MGRIEVPPIIIDTREQRPYEFTGFKLLHTKLEAGDYSIEGYDSRVAVERKSLSDAYGCVGAGRERFERCLQRLGQVERPAIVIEASLDGFCTPPERTRITPRQAVNSFISWSCQYRIPVFWAENREYAERVTLNYLLAFLRHNGGSW